MRIITAALFLLQIYLTFNRYQHFGEYSNPVALFAVSIAIPFLFLIIILRKQEKSHKEIQQPIAIWLPIILTLLASIGVAYYYHLGFQHYAHPETISDVLPQLNILYDRFAKGEQPYYPVPLPGYFAYPVYMPAHWIIIGFARLFSIDTRWIGLLVLLIANLVFVLLYTRKEKSLVNNLLVALAIPYILYAYYKWGEGDLFVSFEEPIAAYYLVLAMGLMIRNFPLTVAGIVLCMLSRYTLVFWLPLFTIILLYEKPLKQNIIAWLIVIGSIVVFYIIPFLLRQPDILLEGVKYHNKAAVNEWSSGAYSFKIGTYFAPHFNSFFSGSFEEKVYKTRIVQGSLMILLNIAGFIGYKKWKNRINYNDFALLMLYIFLVFFYAFGPLTYRYYLITTLTLSAVICSRLLSLSYRNEH